jgi:putative transposase
MDYWRKKVYRTISLRINPRFEEDKARLLKTMELFAKAYNISAENGFATKEGNKIKNSMAVYHRIRNEIPDLQASLVQSACFMATEALKSINFRTLPKKSQTSAIRYSSKGASVYLESGYATIQAAGNRILATFCLPNHFKKYTDWKIKCSFLKYDVKMDRFQLNVVLENLLIPECKEEGVLGIDRGLRNLAVCSNNIFYHSNETKRIKGKFTFLRAQLQSKGTRSAKRKLKKLAGRERRFVDCENHRMAKEIASMPYKTFVLEDLSGIRSKRSPSWELRRDLNQWSYAQFQRDLEYKAEELGKELLVINGMYTSQTCSRCGVISHKSRKGPNFKCVDCGFQLDADLNAARNIAHIGKSEMGRLHASKPNATSNESVPIRGPKDDELSCKSKSELVLADSTSEKDSDNWHLLENDKSYRSTTSFFIECGWTGTRLGGYKPSKRELLEKR